MKRPAVDPEPARRAGGEGSLFPLAPSSSDTATVERGGREHGSTLTRRLLASLRSTLDLLISLTASDLRSRYGRGPLLVVRWLAEPFALVGVYLILTAVVLDRSEQATGLSLACAIVPFQLVILSVSNAMSAVPIRKPIITNMSFRRTLIPVSSVLTESASFVASFGVIAAMMVIYAIAPNPAILWLPVVSAVTMTLAAGLAYPASLFGLWFWELRPVGVSLVRILFFIGPGLVPLSQTSARTSDYLRLNPLTGLFESFRDMFLYGRSPGAWNLLYPLAWGLLLLALFLPIYRRDQREFAKVVE
jgi:ABC-type polysaccharide/polyol phosphate export permease